MQGGPSVAELSLWRSGFGDGLAWWCGAHQGGRGAGEQDDADTRAEPCLQTCALLVGLAVIYWRRDTTARPARFVSVNVELGVTWCFPPIRFAVAWLG